MIIEKKKNEDQPQEILGNVLLIAHKQKLQQKTMESRE